MQWWKYNFILISIIPLLSIISCNNIEPKKIQENNNMEVRSDGLVAAVRNNDIWFFINEKGEDIGLGQFTYADNFSNGWACINYEGSRVADPQGVVGGMFKFINIKGESLDYTLLTPSRFLENRAVIEIGEEFTIIDEDGNNIQEGFESIYSFHNGLAAAKKNNNLGYLNEDGEWEILMRKGDIIYSFHDSIARIKRNNKVGFINPSGQWLVELTEGIFYDFSDGLAAFEQNGLFGFINDHGEIIIEAIYADCTDFKNGLAGVKINDKWGFITKENISFTEPIYKNVRAFSEGLAAVQLDNLVGYINSTGKLEIEPKFEAAYDFKNGYAVAEQDGKLGYINKKGEWHIPPIFERANQLVNVNESNPLFRIN